MCDRHRLGRRLDERQHVIWVGDHRHVVGRDFDGGGPHAPGEQTLGIGRERLVARRMGATTVEVPSSHVAMVSHPDDVVQLIKTAAQAAVTA